jgi:hypothetical protein
MWYTLNPDSDLRRVLKLNLRKTIQKFVSVTASPQRFLATTRIHHALDVFSAPPDHAHFVSKCSVNPAHLDQTRQIHLDRMSPAIATCSSSGERKKCSGWLMNAKAISESNAGSSLHHPVRPRSRQVAITCSRNFS